MADTLHTSTNTSTGNGNSSNGNTAEPTQQTEHVENSSQSDSSKYIRNDWTADEILVLLEAPLMDLVYQAQTVHRAHQQDNAVQLASLMSIKTGACPEDCKYCPQSAHFSNSTGLQREKLLEVAPVLEAAQIAKNEGSTRFCMGAAWRQVRDGEEFDRVIEMVKGVKNMGMEACVTLGMLNEDQAARLKEAGLNAYNHNLDTSPEYYSEIITSRTYDDRLDTLQHVRDAGIGLCTGGIIGMGESLRDRARMLEVLSTMTPHPESVPINALVPVKGTPLEHLEPVTSLELVRMIAAARITMPKARVRLSAGRSNLNREAQLLCIMAGANSIFYGEKLLTTGNNDAIEDRALLKEAGLDMLAPEV